MVLYLRISEVDKKCDYITSKLYLTQFYSEIPSVKTPMAS